MLHKEKSRLKISQKESNKMAGSKSKRLTNLKTPKGLTERNNRKQENCKRIAAVEMDYGEFMNEIAVHKNTFLFVFHY